MLALLAPVSNTGEGVVSYPGDPMCLYGALAVTIDESVRARNSRWEDRDPVRDVYPDWGEYPDDAYRGAVSDDGIRHGDHDVTDMRVFDPRVWNPVTRRALTTVLTQRRPRVLLISAVSAAHRYALDIARTAKTVLPDCYTVLGGRHADETMRWAAGAGALDTHPSATLRLRDTGRIGDEVDAVVAGDGDHLLDVLMTAVALSLDRDTGWARHDDVAERLRDLASAGWGTVGRGVVALLGKRPVVFPVLGDAAAVRDRVAPYKAFAIRSRFSVFPAGERGFRRTAHMMTTASCPFRCAFCSESAAVAGPAARLGSDDVGHVIGRLAETTRYGAEAVFFDDPVFWSGQWRTIAEFARRLAALRRLPRAQLVSALPVLDGANAAGRFLDLQWGVQLTVDLILDQRHSALVTESLDAMRDSGCTYVYIGIESMAASVMDGVHKNLRKRNGQPWEQKVRGALERMRQAGIRVGTSILFGLDGETRATIEHTIDGIGRLIDDGLIVVASPNVLTYHPGTPIARAHGKADLDYHTLLDNREPFTHFEEAYPGVVSDLLTEDDIWFIHETAAARWGSVRNRDEADHHPVQSTLAL
ncbi:B12-binding domain-containing radical SAM protein [Kutzneria sp. CA-103260]|uniref:B12-binding domain-containing radical SAM protein n=1 Tax=Kutzneria sp. CA-103260 TaxID=2802641 RepID=UPI001BABADEE|nr:radical SAM protein [Kutzneria sp. CA-103260]QUQ65338.1 Radical SAM superfamily protein [Kutzneria sp. CA-103260]